MKKTITLSILLSMALTNHAKKGDSRQLNELNSKLNQGGISFTENKGQVHDQNFIPRPDVLFGGTDGKLTFHLKNNGISYQLSKPISFKEIKDEHTNGMKKIIDESTLYRLDVNWLNTNSNTNILKGKAHTGFSNFYNSVCPNGVSNVKSFETITYENIYNGIDLKWYQKDGHLKYDYLVSAGADYKQIKLEIKGAINLRLNAKGELIISTPLGEVIEQAPLVEQNGKVLESKWVLKNHVASFEIRNLNPNENFVIDPAVRLWGTYFGGNSTDEGYACTTDASGNAYITGATQSTGTVLATTGAHQTTFGGTSYNCFLTQFNSSGALQWSTYYGASGYNTGLGCCVDLSNNVYMCGRVSSTISIATPGSHQPNHNSAGIGTEAFLAKFNSSGVRIWGTYYGGNQYNEFGNSCATDPSGNVFMSGYTNSNNGPGVISTIGSHQPNQGGVYDGYLVKFNSAGVRQWATYYGGTGDDYVYGCATNTLGDVYISGRSSTNTGTAIASVGSHQSTVTISANEVAFLAKFDGSGVRQWGTYYGGNEVASNPQCATGPGGEIYLAGTTYITTGTIIATPGSHQPTHGGPGGNSCFLVQFNGAGVRQWGTYYSGMLPTFMGGCTTDVSGNVYIAGLATGGPGSTISTPGGHQITYGGGSSDAFLASFNSSGTRLRGTFYGGAGNEYAYGCSTDPSGNIFMVGYSSANTGTIIASSGAFQTTNNGSNDAFLVKFNDCTLPPLPANTTPTVNQLFCAGNSASLSVSSSTNTFNWFATSSSTTVIGTGNSFVTSTLSAGVYTTYVAEVNACGVGSKLAITYTVSSPVITVNSGTICSGNSFTMMPSGASTYTFQGGNAVVSPTVNASYTVVGTNSLGCVSSTFATSNIIVNANPTITVNSGSICSGQSYTIIPGGASTYTYQGGNAVVSPTANASYTVVGTNSLGCVSNTFAISNIIVNANPTITVNSGAICNGNSFTIAPSGANTYTYQGGNAVVSPTTNTTYTVVGTNTAGCVSVSSATSNVTVNPNPTITVSSGTVCNGQSYTIIPGGANTYTYEGGNAVVSPTTSSTYTVVGTNTVTGCISNPVTSSVSVNPLPNLTTNSTASVTCAGQVVSMAVNGAVTYTWSTGSNSFLISASPTVNTTYSVSGTGANGCQNTIVITHTVNPLPIISVNSGSICPGNSFTMIPGGASTYTYQGGNAVVSPMISTSYTVIGTSVDGCVSASPAISNIMVYTAPTITVNNGSICTGNSFTITPSGASTYTIQGNNSIVSPTVSTTYTVAGTDVNGCVSVNTATSNVTVNSTPTISINSGSICLGGSFTLTPGGANTYTIEGGNAVVNPTINTTYTVAGTDANGCVSASPATSSVTINALPTVAAVSSTSLVCTGETATLTASGANTYTWNTSATSTSITISPTTTASYTVTGTDVNGCVNTAVITQSVDACIGLREYDTESIALDVYPNPSTGVITIEAKGAVKNSTMILTNTLGQVVYKSIISEGKTKIDLSEQNRGIYFIQILSNNKTIATRKIIKQ